MHRVISAASCVREDAPLQNASSGAEGIERFRLVTRECIKGAFGVQSAINKCIGGVRGWCAPKPREYSA